MYETYYKKFFEKIKDKYKPDILDFDQEEGLPEDMLKKGRKLKDIKKLKDAKKKAKEAMDRQAKESKILSRQKRTILYDVDFEAAWKEK